MDYANSPIYRVYIFIVILIVCLDQIIKYIVLTNIELNQSIPVIGSFFQLAHIHNYGAAFSILQDKQTFLIATVSAVCVFLIFLLIKKWNMYHISILIGISLIIGGGIGNLIDRIRFGYVIDFLQFGSFPIFNLADISVVCGSSLLLIYVIIIEPREMKDGVVKDGKKIA